MDQDAAYFRSREQIELEAAAAAPSEQARRAHEELARGYAALANSSAAKSGLE